MHSGTAVNWLLFFLLALIWGSSFILMKEGMLHLNAFEVASFRICTAAIVMLPIGIKAFRSMPGNKIGYAFLSGLLGSFFPAYFFCIAETRIGSALAGTLNSLTPVFVIITAALFFRRWIPSRKVIGILIAFSGSVFLLFVQPEFSGFRSGGHIALIVLATLMYGTNVNLVHRHLAGFPAIHVVAIALILSAIPSAVIGLLSGWLDQPFTSGVWYSFGAAAVLGILGTSLASILFYKLIYRAGVVFASMVTYGIPFVANFWGWVYGENIGWLEILSLLVILFGVYLANSPSATGRTALSAKSSPETGT